MSKHLILLLLLLSLSACASHEVMVKPLNVAESSYSIHCDGAFNKWDSCNQKAAELCPRGTYLIDKIEGANSSRELMVKCY